MRTTAGATHSSSRATWSSRLEVVAFVFFIAIIAWAPFPLGSNRPWSWSLLTILVAACWLLWGISRLIAPSRGTWPLQYLLPPLLLFGTALVWALVQVSPFVPAEWGHPVWGIASDTLGRAMQPEISIDPWRTATEIMKLVTYLAAGILAFAFSRDTGRASKLMTALIAIVSLYALYGAVLPLLKISQNQIFYSSWGFRDPISGPFVLHNSYATYLGLGLILAAVHLYTAGSRSIFTSRGPRQQALSTLQYLVGKGVWGFLAVLSTFAVLVATASRAGFLAAMTGLAVLMLCGVFLAERRGTITWALAGTGAMLGFSSLFFFANGDRLQTRFNALVEAGGLDEVRATLWDSAIRMIADAPFLGFGLGTFERAYPFYADRIFPFVMDKVHNDYLEFAAGLGLPAAIAWWSAIAWCAFLCVRALFIRRRNRSYPVAALGATALVAFHSAFDFSLQMPAVAITYAAILGLGMAQAFPTRDA